MSTEQIEQLMEVFLEGFRMGYTRGQENAFVPEPRQASEHKAWKAFKAKHNIKE